MFESFMIQEQMREEEKKMIHDRGQRPSGEVVRTNIHRVVDAKARQNLEVNP